MFLKPAGLWRHHNFMLLWTGQTISVFGSMIGVVAMSFTAILFLHATPFQLGVLGAARLVPGFLTSLLAGAWVDRLRRRPILIATDIARAVVLASIPLAAYFHELRMGQLYMVAFLMSILTIFFDVSYESYLPSIVRREDLIESNSKLSASASISEIGGFSVAGWLVQLFTAPFGILIDAFSFIFSAIFLSFISSKEQSKAPVQRQSIRVEIGEGLNQVIRNPLLKASAICTIIRELSWGINGTLVLLYMTKGIGFQPGILGVIWAVGGVSSLFAAVVAARTTKRFGIGPTMIMSLLFAGVAMTFIPLAKGATLASALLLIASQLLGDGAVIIYEINKVSLQQSVAPKAMLGRVNASMQFIGIGATLVGSLLGGILGEIIGVRPTLMLGAFGVLLSMCWLLFSPIRKLYTMPEASEV